MALIKREKIAYDLGYRVINNYVFNPEGNKISDHLGSNNFRVFCINHNKKYLTISIHALLGYELFGEKIWNKKFRIHHIDKNKLNNIKSNIEIIKWIGARNKDLSGNKIGKLLILEKRRDQNKSITYYLCKCDCGNETIVSGSNLKSQATKSCGCLQYEYLTEGQRKPVNDVVCTRIITYYKRNAKSRNIKWDLTREKFKELIFLPCYYCGSLNKLMSEAWKSSSILKNEVPHNGIDRKDNDQGYTESNSVTCCTNCNFAKNSFSFEEFKNWAIKLAENIKNII